MEDLSFNEQGKQSQSESESHLKQSMWANAHPTSQAFATSIDFMARSNDLHAHFARVW